MIGNLLVIMILISINAFFAAAEISVVSLKKISLEKKAGEGDVKAGQLLNIVNEPSKFLTTIQVGVTLASFYTSAYAAVALTDTLNKFFKSTNIYIIKEYSADLSLFIITIVVSFLSLLFGELVPKRIALKKADFVAYNSVGVIKTVEIVTKPLVVTLTVVTNFILKIIFKEQKESEDQITEEEIRMMINVGEEKGIFRKTETDMINSIFEFDDTTVSDVMTPRPDIIALDIECSFNEVIQVITSEKYSRIPVYEDSIDNVSGVLYTKDIIDYMAFRSEKVFQLRDFIKKPFFVTEYKKIDILLKEMQKNSVHISIVIDEYGTTAGVVTIEDMLEKIVGEIYDEYDEKEEEISIKGSNEYEIDAGISMFELNELLHSKYNENYDTVSGLILDSLGRFPEEGESIIIENNIFTILEIENFRIKRIQLKKEK